MIVGYGTRRRKTACIYASLLYPSGVYNERTGKRSRTIGQRFDEAQHKNEKEWRLRSYGNACIEPSATAANCVPMLYAKKINMASEA